MGWINQLAKVYEINKSKIGVMEGDNILLPLYHSSNNAQIEVTLDIDGNFMLAEPVAKDDSYTVIPVTEDSVARSSGIAPHPLCDKLIYVAGDYTKYCSKKSKDAEYYQSYIAQLKSWAAAGNSHPKVKAIYAYLSKGCLISDLISAKVLSLDENGKLDEKVSIASIKQPDCFVRFSVTDALPYETYKDRSLFDNFIKYYAPLNDNIDLCYVTGEQLPITYKHISKIRNTGDKAKLISANDSTNFTYRGRFKVKEEAFAVSDVISQKAHLALRWLITRQGIHFGDNCIVAFDCSGAEDNTPDITSDTNDAFGITIDPDKQAKNAAYVKSALHDAIFGTKLRFDETDRIIVIGLDSATTGRLSMCMYREFSKTKFYENLINWHSSFCWDMAYYDDQAKKYINYVGAPPLLSIAKSAYGTYRDNKLDIDDKILKSLVMKLIPCVIDDQPLPSDFYIKLLENAGQRTRYKTYDQWYRALKYACAAINRKHYEKTKEVIPMALDPNNNDISYIYGRLLAVIDMAEKAAYSDSDKDSGKMSNAEKYTDRLISRPADTLGILYQKLSPYLAKLGENKFSYNQKLKEIADSIDNVKAFTDIQRLGPSFFIGYYHQHQNFYIGKSKKTSDETKEND